MKGERRGGRERLGRFLARAGVAARRQAERLIREGRVTVNGRVVYDPAMQIDPVVDAVRVDGGRRILGPAPPVYFLLHKPRGVVCTMEDPEGRPCVGDLLGEMKGHPVPVGRLDFDAEGLLLCTNDGELAHRLVHPRYHVQKVYHVKVHGIPDRGVIDRLRRGVVLDGRKTLPAMVHLLKTGRRNSWLRMVIVEGRNRQVKRMLEKVGFPVMRLRRVGFGPLRLTGLSVGEFRKLRPDEVQALRMFVEEGARKAARSGGGTRGRRPSSGKRPGRA